MSKTLGELAEDLADRIGFRGNRAESEQHAAILRSFLQSANYQLYNAHDWKVLHTYAEITTEADEAFYDLAADCNLERLWNVASLVSGTWTPLTAGIEWEHRSSNTAGAPLRFEVLTQLELWPVPDGEYTLRYYYVKAMPSFELETDTPAVDEHLVFLHALANAKAHFGQQDAAIYASQLDSLLAKLKATNRRRPVFQRDRHGDPYDLAYQRYPVKV